MWQLLGPHPQYASAINWNRKQGVFAYTAPWKFAKVSRVWMLIRGIIMWLIWKEPLDESGI